MDHFTFIRHLFINQISINYSMQPTQPPNLEVNTLIISKKKKRSLKYFFLEICVVNSRTQMNMIKTILFSDIIKQLFMVIKSHATK